MWGGTKNPPNISGAMRPGAALGLDLQLPPQEPQGSAFPRLVGPWAGAAPGTHTGWEHSCGLQARRMALGLVRASQKPRCTILWSSLRRQPYLVNWEPEDESSRGLMGHCGPSGGRGPGEVAPRAASAPGSPSFQRDGRGGGGGSVPGPGLGDVQPSTHPALQAQLGGRPRRVATLFPGPSAGFLGQGRVASITQ